MELIDPLSISISALEAVVLSTLFLLLKALIALPQYNYRAVLQITVSKGLYPAIILTKSVMPYHMQCSQASGCRVDHCTSGNRTNVYGKQNSPWTQQTRSQIA